MKRQTLTTTAIRRGFTLTELLIVMAILVLLVAILALIVTLITFHQRGGNAEFDAEDRIEPVARLVILQGFRLDPAERHFDARDAVECHARFHVERGVDRTMRAVAHRVTLDAQALAQNVPMVFDTTRTRWRRNIRLAIG